MTKRTTLAEWLAYQEALHPNAIDMGLDRLSRVLHELNWKPFGCPVITIGGTNGKGSCVALAECILTSAGYRVGAFTSPHLVRYNERIRIAGREVSDDELLWAFERIEAARKDISITFFEFNTLAALLIFEREHLDAVVLEVGLGGRLDAVNVVDADAAIISSVALDHCAWLGNDVESIGRWKAGIYRPNRPAIFGSKSMPRSVSEEAQRIGAQLLRLGAEFDYSTAGKRWEYRFDVTLSDLPLPALPGAIQLENAASVLTALRCLSERLPISRASIESGLQRMRLRGRFQVITAKPALVCEWILDVAHNPAAAATLAQNLRARSPKGRTMAVCGMFADKDVGGVIAAVKPCIDTWIVATVGGARSLSGDQLADKIIGFGGTVAKVATDVKSACDFARSIASVSDRVVVFGSFHTVGPALEWLHAAARDIET